MTRTIRKSLQIGLAAALGFGALLANENFTELKSGAFVSKAQAIIGRRAPHHTARLCRRRRRLWRAGLWRAGRLWRAGLRAGLLPGGQRLWASVYPLPLTAPRRRPAARGAPVTPLPAAGNRE